MTARAVAVLIALLMTVSVLPVSAFATKPELMTPQELRAEYGAITVEAYNIGQGFIVEPSLYAKEGKSVGDITVDLLSSENLTYKGDTSYFSGIEFDDTIAPVYPDYMEPYLGELSDSGDGDGYLAEFDYSQYAGWCFTIDDWWASYGADSSYPGQEITDYNTGEQVTLGDVIRWHFTVSGYGADCGFPGNVMAEWMGGNLFVQEDKTELIFLLAAVNDYYGNLDSDDVYETALAVASEPLSSAEAIEEQEEILADYIEATFFTAEETPRQAKDVSDTLDAVLAQLAVDVPEPVFASVGGEWSVLCLARGDYYRADSEYFTDYYERIVEYVNTEAASINKNGALHKNKSTENSRLILALSAIGKDARAVGDWNLVEAYSANGLAWIKRQGINGPIWTLIALDTVGYETSDPTIREQCIEYILDSELEGGGWSSGTSIDPDMTGMALQALAPYRDDADVSAAGQRAFVKLSKIQQDNGGFYSWGTVNAESCAQVIVACTAWGINPDTDPMFVKGDKSVLDALLAHLVADGNAFEHIIGSGKNAMATDQACYALVAYDRFMNRQTALYDMTDGLSTCVVGIQTAAYSENETDYCAIRFLATVDAKMLNSQSVKFKITASCTKDGNEYAVADWENRSSKTYEISITEAYTYVNAGDRRVAANEIEGASSTDDYICAAAIKKIPHLSLADVNITFTVEIVAETAFGTVLTGEAKTVTICNGQVV